MTKSNPLFVDSTKFHGEQIGTKIELNRILVYNDEKVIAVVTDHEGKAQRIPMEPTEENGRYEARVWLSHQKPVTYRFVIERNGSAQLRTAERKSRAQYAIIEDWDPIISDEPIVEEVIAPPPPKKTADWRSTIVDAGSVLEKWGL